MVAVFLLSVVAAAQPDAGAASSFQDIQGSHIDGNVPESADFEKFLRRDLSEYFSATRKTKKVSVEYEPLRQGATQSGVSYPKFYLWVRIGGGRNPQDRGAVRVAAIDKKRFEVTDFLSEEAIRSDPKGIYRVFPAPVCQKINAKVTQ